AGSHDEGHRRTIWMDQGDLGLVPHGNSHPVVAATTGGHSVGRRTPCCRMTRLIPAQQRLAKTASGFLGAGRIVAKGKRFSYDCSGLARGVYFAQGIDLVKGVSSWSGQNGVRLIYQHISRHGRLHTGPVVQPGDLVFFHNTWDANGDGRVNDRWTHVGIVERVQDDGTVVFISRVSRGIERYRINLRYPHLHRSGDGRLLNDFMRKKRRTDPSQTQYLTGQLFAAFGTLTH
ncbi:MAG: CHAP domain-containing protein, partial [Nitrospirales bacterium]